MGDLGVAVKRILIVGAGAIGGTMAGYLARAGREIHVADHWFHHVETIRTHGLRVEAPDERFSVRLPALHIDQLDRLPGPVDVLVIATKAYDTEWVYRLAVPYLASDGVVLSAQNGMVEELLPRYADMRAVVGCSVIFAGECMEPGLVIRRSPASWPVLAMGELDGRPSRRIDQLTDLLAPVGEVQATSAILGKLWAKLVVNAMSNGTAALTSATSGMVWGDEAFAPVTVALAAETAMVASARGVQMEPVFGRLPAEVLVQAYEGDETAAAVASARFSEVAAERGAERDNKPSMLQDIVKGRRTEIDYLNGYVAARAAEAGIAVPLNERLAELVREVDRGERTCEPRNLQHLTDALGVRQTFPTD
jgi:2-dehydropantoate 2-reductase